MSRATKLTPEVHRKTVDCVRAGNYLEVAAAYAGVDKTTFYRWLKKGEAQATGPYRRFKDDLDAALAHSEVRDVLTIGKAAESQWQAAAWRLERKHPGRWRQKSDLNLSGNLSVSSFRDALRKGAETPDIDDGIAP